MDVCRGCPQQKAVRITRRQHRALHRSSTKSYALLGSRLIRQHAHFSSPDSDMISHEYACTRMPKQRSRPERSMRAPIPSDIRSYLGRGSTGTQMGSAQDSWLMSWPIWSSKQHCCTTRCSDDSLSPLSTLARPKRRLRREQAAAARSSMNTLPGP